jgi:hypothetical protein
VELKSAFLREFKVVFPGKVNSEIQIQCDGATLKSVKPTGAPSEISFTALPGKTYRVAQSKPS